MPLSSYKAADFLNAGVLVILLKKVLTGFFFILRTSSLAYTCKPGDDRQSVLVCVFVLVCACRLALYKMTSEWSQFLNVIHTSGHVMSSWFLGER